MTEFINTYLYLFSQIVWICLYFFGLLFLKGKRSSILFSSVAALPQAFLGGDVYSGTWVPNRILVIGAGVEDFIFCFLLGGLAWITTIFVIQKRVTIQFQFRGIIKRFLISLLFGIVATAALYLLDIREYLNSFIVMVIWCIVIFAYKKNYWPFLIIGSSSFFIVYMAGLLIGLFIWPDLLSLWNLENFSGISFLRIPLEELVWAFLYGGTWSLTIAFLLDVRLHKEFRLTK